MPSKIESYPISGSWNNGTGQFLNSPQTTNGCSWTDRLSSGSGAWADNSNLSAYVTASYSGSDGIGGGNWIEVPAGRYQLRQTGSRRISVGWLLLN